MHNKNFSLAFIILSYSVFSCSAAEYFAPVGHYLSGTYNHALDMVRQAAEHLNMMQSPPTNDALIKHNKTLIKNNNDIFQKASRELIDSLQNNKTKDEELTRLMAESLGYIAEPISTTLQRESLRLNDLMDAINYLQQTNIDSKGVNEISKRIEQIATMSTQPEPDLGTSIIQYKEKELEPLNILLGQKNSQDFLESLQQGVRLDQPQKESAAGDSLMSSFRAGPQAQNFPQKIESQTAKPNTAEIQNALEQLNKISSLLTKNVEELQGPNNDITAINTIKKHIEENIDKLIKFVEASNFAEYKSATKEGKMDSNKPFHLTSLTLLKNKLSTITRYDDSQWKIENLCSRIAQDIRSTSLVDTTINATESSAWPKSLQDQIAYISTQSDWDTQSKTYILQVLWWYALMQSTSPENALLRGIFIAARQDAAKALTNMGQKTPAITQVGTGVPSRHFSGKLTNIPTDAPKELKQFLYEATEELLKAPQKLTTTKDTDLISSDETDLISSDEWENYKTALENHLVTISKDQEDERKKADEQIKYATEKMNTAKTPAALEKAQQRKLSALRENIAKRIEELTSENGPANTNQEKIISLEKALAGDNAQKKLNPEKANLKNRIKELEAIIQNPIPKADEDEAAIDKLALEWRKTASLEKINDEINKRETTRRKSQEENPPLAPRQEYSLEERKTALERELAGITDKEKQEKLEQERLEQEKLEQERLEQEKLEQERSKKETLEKEKLESKRLTQEAQEQENLLREMTTNLATLKNPPQNNTSDNVKYFTNIAKNMTRLEATFKNIRSNYLQQSYNDLYKEYKQFLSTEADKAITNLLTNSLCKDKKKTLAEQYFNPNNDPNLADYRTQAIANINANSYIQEINNILLTQDSLNSNQEVQNENEELLDLNSNLPDQVPSDLELQDISSQRQESTNLNQKLPNNRSLIVNDIFGIYHLKELLNIYNKEALNALTNNQLLIGNYNNLLGNITEEKKKEFFANAWEKLFGNPLIDKANDIEAFPGTSTIKIELPQLQESAIQRQQKELSKTLEESTQKITLLEGVKEKEKQSYSPQYFHSISELITQLNDLQIHYPLDQNINILLDRYKKFLAHEAKDAIDDVMKSGDPLTTHLKLIQSYFPDTDSNLKPYQGSFISTDITDSIKKITSEIKALKNGMYSSDKNEAKNRILRLGRILQLANEEQKDLISNLKNEYQTLDDYYFILLKVAQNKKSFSDHWKNIFGYIPEQPEPEVKPIIELKNIIAKDLSSTSTAASMSKLEQKHLKQQASTKQPQTFSQQAKPVEKQQEPIKSLRQWVKATPKKTKQKTESLQKEKERTQLLTQSKAGNDRTTGFIKAIGDFFKWIGYDLWMANNSY